MVDFRPFRALYYDSNKVGSLDDVIVPPYDVISERDKKQFFKKSPFNFARIILGSSKDQYASVGKTFRKWIKEGVFLKSDPAFYVWEQQFLKEGQFLTRFGVVSAVALRDFRKGNILPHENTFAAPIEDRLRILKACQANLSPIFMTYDDPRRELEEKLFKCCQTHRLDGQRPDGQRPDGPFLEFKDTEGVRSLIYKIEDKAMVKFIHQFFLKKKLYIIDGHHRFATALFYSEQKKSSGGGGFDQVLSVIINMGDPALVVYPIYRLLKPHRLFYKENYLRTLRKDFKIKQTSKVVPLKRREWGIQFFEDSSFYILTVTPQKLKWLMKEMKLHLAVKNLDVAILQEKIIPKEVSKNIRYVRGMGERLGLAEADLRRGKYVVLWRVNAPTIEELKKVAEARQVMPAKSTFFYPKVLSGALIRPF